MRRARAQDGAAESSGFATSSGGRYVWSSPTIGPKDVGREHDGVTRPKAVR
jgi:hypothetical protein